MARSLREKGEERAGRAIPKVTARKIRKIFHTSANILQQKKNTNGRERLWKEEGRQVLGRVESRCNDVPRDWRNHIVISGYRYKRIPDITILEKNSHSYRYRRGRVINI